MRFKTSHLALLAALALGTACGDYSEDLSYGGGYDGDYDDSAGDGQVMPGEDARPEEEPEDEEDPETRPEEPACNAADDVTLFLSPDDSNSMSSPVQVREAVLDGFSSLYQVPIRTWEFMNYYSFDYPAAEAGGVQVNTSMMVPKGAGPGEYTMQIAVSSERIAPADRAPLNITLVLDASGSMGGHPMDMVKASARAMASSLREGDIISMVTWDTANQVILAAHAVQGADDPVLLAAIDQLEPGGGTNLHGGLTAGYDLAEQAYDANRINRIVLMSDGGANAGVTDIDLIASHAGDNNGDGIYMVGVGMGDAGTYHDRLMDSVTDAGKGASVFINDEAEAQRIFGDQFISTLDVAVRDVQVRLEMPPGFSVVRFSGEEISTDPTEVEPQHLAPNDTMIFHQQLETCAPELVDEQTAFTVAVRYQDGTTFESHEVRTEVSFGELLAASDPLLLKGAAVFAYAEGLKLHQIGDADAMAEALDALELAEAANPEDPDLSEIRQVINAL